jgi:hypothetical protein
MVLVNGISRRTAVTPRSPLMARAGWPESAEVLGVLVRPAERADRRRIASGQALVRAALVQPGVPGQAELVLLGGVL